MATRTRVPAPIQAQDLYPGIYSKAEKTLLPLKNIQIRAQVTDLVADVEVTQKFLNRSTSPVEAVFKFEQHKAVLSNFEAVIGGVKLSAMCEEKLKAQDKYDDAIASGQTAFLAEQPEPHNPNLFQVSLGNLPPSKTCFVTFRFAMELESARNRLDFLLPLTALKVFSAGSGEPAFSLDMDIILPNKISQITSNLFSTGAVTITDKNAKIHFVDEEYALPLPLSVNIVMECAHELVLFLERYSPAQGNSNFYLPALPAIKKERADSTALLVSLVPQVETFEDSVTELIFVIDRSGSMLSLIQQARNAMQLFLRSIPVDTPFNIISFGSQTSSLFQESEALNEQSFAVASKHVAAIQANMGGTDIYAALSAALNSKRLPGYSRQIFLLTDGEDRRMPTIIQLVKDRAAGDLRIFSLGIGASASRELVEGIARHGGGDATFVSADEKIENKVINQLQIALRPIITDLKVDWKDVPLDDNFQEYRDNPPAYPSIFDANRMLIYAVLDSSKLESPDFQIVVTGKTGSQAHTWTVPLNKQNIIEGSVIHRLCAHSYVKHLLKEKTKNEDKIREFGLDWGIVTPFTSFVSVKDTVDSDCASQTMKLVDINLDLEITALKALEQQRNTRVVATRTAPIKQAVPAPARAPAYVPRERRISKVILEKEKKTDYWQEFIAEAKASQPDLSQDDIDALIERSLSLALVGNFKERQTNASVPTHQKLMEKLTARLAQQATVSMPRTGTSISYLLQLEHEMQKKEAKQEQEQATMAEKLRAKIDDLRLQQQILAKKKEQERDKNTQTMILEMQNLKEQITLAAQNPNTSPEEFKRMNQKAARLEAALRQINDERKNGSEDNDQALLKKKLALFEAKMKEIDEEKKLQIAHDSSDLMKEKLLLMEEKLAKMSRRKSVSITAIVEQKMQEVEQQLTTLRGSDDPLDATKTEALEKKLTELQQAKVQRKDVNDPETLALRSHVKKMEEAMLAAEQQLTRDREKYEEERAQQSMKRQREEESYRKKSQEREQLLLSKMAEMEKRIASSARAAEPSQPVGMSPGLMARMAELEARLNSTEASLSAEKNKTEKAFNDLLSQQHKEDQIDHLKIQTEALLRKLEGFSNQMDCKMSSLSLPPVQDDASLDGAAREAAVQERRRKAEEARVAAAALEAEEKEREEALSTRRASRQPVSTSRQPSGSTPPARGAPQVSSAFSGVSPVSRQPVSTSRQPSGSTPPARGAPQASSVHREVRSVRSVPTVGSAPLNNAMEFVLLQSFDGSFAFSDAFARATGLSQDTIKSIPEESFSGGDLPHDVKVILWITAIAIAFLELKFQETKSEWTLVATKSTKFLQRKCNAVQLIAEATKFLKMNLKL